jgi:NADP-dependent 3-hydroxy acid dehydrogenase YdfG
MRKCTRFRPIQNGDLDDWDAMIDINVKGLLYVSKAIIPQMIERKSGHIINIGSIAGKEVYQMETFIAPPNMLLTPESGDANGPESVWDSCEHPGAVETEFSEVRFKGDTERAANVYF